jgi:serine phosphatase RsbU (regulator of sigma subunit)/anti-sigma regulatory factor (Ser/Thr protein kinase)
MAMRSVTDVLISLGTGVWHWDNESDNVALDAVCAGLLGLPPEAATVHSAAVRACYHPVDYVRASSAMALAISEGRVSQANLRVVGDDGTVLRTVTLRAYGVIGGTCGVTRDGVTRDCVTREGGASDGVITDEAWPKEIIGTVHEVADDGRLDAVDGGRPTASEDGQRAREAFLLDAARALAEAESTAQVLRVASNLAMPGFQPDGLAVFGLQGRDRISVIGHHGQQPGDELPFNDMPLTTDYPATAVVRTGRAVYLPSPEAYEERFPATWQLAKPFGRSSWAFLPLVVTGRTIGVWMAGFREPVAFTPDERSVLTTVARMLAQALSRAHLYESERELTDGLQRTMLPARKPGIEGMSVAARYVPSGGGLQVGGDWYDVIDLPSGRTALVIGDVQGHDVRAAGLMGQLRIALRAYAAEGHGPDAVLSRASRFLAGLTTGEDEDRFATCLYIEADPATGTLDVARAGHPEPAVRLPDGTTIVRCTAGGLPLGIAPDSDYPRTRFTLEPGEVLLLCTDGLIETGGHDLDTGWRRLRAAVAGTAADDLEALADTLVEAVHGPASRLTTGPLADRREDDIALLLLAREPDGAVCRLPVRRTVLTVAQSEPRQIRAARKEVRALLHDWREPDGVDSAVLLVSELLTNVLVHTDDDAVLTAELLGVPGGRRLRIDVGDRGDDMPHPRRPGEMASSGRGLLLLEELAHAWGVEPRGDNKAIWFELYEVPPGRER